MRIRHVTVGLLTVGMLVAQETQQAPQPDFETNVDIVMAPVTVLDALREGPCPV